MLIISNIYSTCMCQYSFFLFHLKICIYLRICICGSSFLRMAHQVLYTPSGWLTDELSLLATHAHNYNGGTQRRTQSTSLAHAFVFFFFFCSTFMSFLTLSQTIIGTRWTSRAVPAGAQTHGRSLSVLHCLVTEAQLMQEPIQHGCIQMDNSIRILIYNCMLSLAKSICAFVLFTCILYSGEWTPTETIWQPSTLNLS